MKLFKPIFWLLAVLFGAFLDVYIYLSSVLRKKMVKLDAKGAGGTKKENPNKMLFISCGGFVE